MAEPLVAQKGPYEQEVLEGRIYFWCACGRSASQPFCDGSHKGTGIEPIRHQPERTETVWFCGCKRSASRPFCDGTHNSL